MESLKDDCLFCKIIQGKIPCKKVYENETVFAFLDINPIAVGHTLVIPKYHAAQCHEVPEDYMAGIGKALSVVAKAVGAKNYNILQNNGSIAHQAVFHVHFHIIPKDAKQGLGIQWPATNPSGDELEKTAEEIKSRI